MIHYNNLKEKNMFDFKFLTLRHHIFITQIDSKVQYISIVVQLNSSKFKFDSINYLFIKQFHFIIITFCSIESFIFI